MPVTPINPPSAGDQDLGFLLQIGDSALPTGAFSHSFGLESYIADHQIVDEPSLTEWLVSYLGTQLACTEALALRWVVTGERDVHEVDALLDAAMIPTDVHLASTRMGAQLAKLGPVVLSGSTIDDEALPPAGGWPRHFATVYAVMGAAAQVEIPLLLQTFMTSSITSLVHNAVRAVPLGQLAGQRVITVMRSHIPATAAAVMELSKEDFATTAPGLEIAQMRHEYQRARMFMS